MLARATHIIYPPLLPMKQLDMLNCATINVATGSDHVLSLSTSKLPVSPDVCHCVYRIG